MTAIRRRSAAAAIRLTPRPSSCMSPIVPDAGAPPLRRAWPAVAIHPPDQCSAVVRAFSAATRVAALPAPEEPITIPMTLPSPQTQRVSAAPESVTGAQWKLTPLSLETDAVVRLKVTPVLLLKPATNWLRSDDCTVLPSLV